MVLLTANVTYCVAGALDLSLLFVNPGSFVCQFVLSQTKRSAVECGSNGASESTNVVFCESHAAVL